MGEQPEDSTSTLPEDPSPQALLRERRLRGGTLLFVSMLVVLGAFGFLGVRTTTSSAASGGYWIEVSYATVTRAGLATPFGIEIGTDDGSALPATVTIGVSSDYLALFDDNGMEPSARTSFNTPDTTWWEFDVPEGQAELSVDLDFRLEPAVQAGKAATAELWIDGRLVIGANFTTRVMP